ncbi:hypothetical protein AMTRI_Chr08g165050 [Amborella trichopoda]
MSHKRSIVCMFFPSHHTSKGIIFLSNSRSHGVFLESPFLTQILLVNMYLVQLLDKETHLCVPIVSFLSCLLIVVSFWGTQYPSTFSRCGIIITDYSKYLGDILNQELGYLVLGASFA